MFGSGHCAHFPQGRLRSIFVFAGTLLSFAVAATASDTSLWDPPAIDVFPDQSALASGLAAPSEFVSAGRRLFITQFNILDGAGRPEATGDSKPTIRSPVNRLFQRIAGPDANSCAGCHNAPFVGGSGDLAANVFVGAHFTDPPTESIGPDITNERNTMGMFGAGAVEMLAREMTADLQDIRDEARLRAASGQASYPARLTTKGVEFGTLVAHPDGSLDTLDIRGVDADLVVRPFGAKGVAASLREFTVFALNQHHGIQAVERFGWPRTGTADFDGDGTDDEFSVGQVTALVLFQAALPAPARSRPLRAADAAVAARGEALFGEIGCADCHRPSLPLRSAWFMEPSPYNRPGTVVPGDVGGQVAIPLGFSPGTGIFRDDAGGLFIAAFTDLKRHVICDADDPYFCNEQRRQDFVPVDQFLTAKLWEAGSSGPYGHRGDLTTLSEAIIHHSGEAKEVKRRFLSLPDSDKTAIIAFLKTLQVMDDFSGLAQWR